MSDSRHVARTVTAPSRVVSDRAGSSPARPATPYDALPEESFDRVARLAATALRSPVSIVSLVDDDRHVVKSSVGLTGRSRVWRKVPIALRYVRQVATSGRPVFVGNTTETSGPTGCELSELPRTVPSGRG